MTRCACYVLFDSPIYIADNRVLALMCSLPMATRVYLYPRALHKPFERGGGGVYNLLTARPGRAFLGRVINRSKLDRASRDKRESLRDLL